MKSDGKKANLAGQSLRQGRYPESVDQAEKRRGRRERKPFASTAFKLSAKAKGFAGSGSNGLQISSQLAVDQS